MFTDKEKFITAMTIYVTSETARKISREKRQQILLFIRNKYCPTVTDKDWSEIAQDINTHRDEFLTHATETIEQADDNPEIVMGDPDTAELDRSMQENPDEVNMDELEETAENVSDKDESKFNIKKIFKKVANKKEESETGA